MSTTKNVQAEASPSGKPYELGLARTTWEAIALVRAAMIEHEADEQRIEPGPRARIGELLGQVRQMVVDRPSFGWRRLRMWWSGTRIESAWRGIHAAEVVLYEHMREPNLRPRLGGIYGYARSYLGEQDLRVVQLHLLVGREIGEGTIEHTDRTGAVSADREPVDREHEDDLVAPDDGLAAPDDEPEADIGGPSPPERS